MYNIVRMAIVIFLGGNDSVTCCKLSISESSGYQKNPMWKRDGNAWLHDFHPSDPIVYDDCLEITHFFSLLVFCCVDICVIRSSSLYCIKLLTLLGWLHRPTPCCIQWAHSYCAGSPETWCQDYQSSGTVCNSGQCNLTVMLSRQCL